MNVHSTLIKIANHSRCLQYFAISISLRYFTQVPKPAVHLKDCITMAGVDVMTISNSEPAQKIFRVCFKYLAYTNYCHSLSMKTHIQIYIYIYIYIYSFNIILI